MSRGKPVTHWQVRAESAAGALFTCGLAAPDADQAASEARKVVPFMPAFLEVMPVEGGRRD
jgi:hypothetical protein